jgi:hypothetical protein
MKKRLALGDEPAAVIKQDWNTTALSQPPLPRNHLLRPVYVVRLRSPDGADARRLRWFLKMALRRLGLRCLSIEIEVPR